MVIKNNYYQVIAAFLVLFMLSACVGMPDKMEPVQGFDINKYLGKWYEIARLDHSFERGMSNVTAEYSLKEDGGVLVKNKGFDVNNGEWTEALGKAYFVEESDIGYLKVSFFGPFYGSYVVFELEHNNYQYAFVSGPNLSYLWLLSRTPNLDDEVIDKFVTQAKRLGFDTQALIFVEQDMAKIAR
jgi:apolipoprotein D and lipocalin family protein